LPFRRVRRIRYLPSLFLDLGVGLCLCLRPLELLRELLRLLRPGYGEPLLDNDALSSTPSRGNEFDHKRLPALGAERELQPVNSAITRVHLLSLPRSPLSGVCSPRLCALHIPRSPGASPLTSAQSCRSRASQPSASLALSG